MAFYGFQEHDGDEKEDGANRRDEFSYSDLAANHRETTKNDDNEISNAPHACEF